ncbi:MAG: hypothetical protein JWP97_946, partial [Labilithrix sp.]|nr:hypothetical protein [Labilithrix sp.]
TTGRGVAVVALGEGASDEAFALARAVYGSRLRPPALDEVRARVLAGAPPPANASRELRDLAEIRASIAGDDAPGRRLLAGLAQQVGAEALLVVRAESAPRGEASPPADAGADDAGNASPARAVVARLFLVDGADFDAARYAPDAAPDSAKTPAAWKSTVTSLEGRFPARSREAAPAAATAQVPPPVPLVGEKKSTPFYASAWFWGAVGGAALLGTAFYFASRDTNDSTIHLQMRVPR